MYCDFSSYSIGTQRCTSSAGWVGALSSLQKIQHIATLAITGRLRSTRLTCYSRSSSKPSAPSKRNQSPIDLLLASLKLRTTNMAVVTPVGQALYQLPRFKTRIPETRELSIEEEGLDQAAFKVFSDGSGGKDRSRSSNLQEGQKRTFLTSQGTSRALDEARHLRGRGSRMSP